MIEDDLLCAGKVNSRRSSCGGLINCYSGITEWYREGAVSHECFSRCITSQGSFAFSGDGTLLCLLNAKPFSIQFCSHCCFGPVAVGIPNDKIPNDEIPNGRNPECRNPERSKSRRYKIPNDLFPNDEIPKVNFLIKDSQGRRGLGSLYFKNYMHGNRFR
ncbi:hypothetical protein M513_13405 [Trichuris suis]|uniref:Uncharacterized protein n=1 Tax=Trichuris suis TaxID=68888 RepID=A0A085LL70_9BILA|nr:hypothetical protein M513_13405 [Trichuris suis]